MRPPGNNQSNRWQPLPNGRGSDSTSGPRVLLSVLVLAAVNLIIAAPLFGVEYSAYNGSIEGTFIAIARVMAQHPGDWKWWPLWNAGMPFENSYLPLLHWMVAAFSLLTG
jgi:hypothetical protein